MDVVMGISIVKHMTYQKAYNKISNNTENIAVVFYKLLNNKAFFKEMQTNF